MITKKEAQAIIDAMIKLRDSATDEQAKNVSILYPKWEINKEYKIGDRVVYENVLYTVIQEHVSKNVYSPDIAFNLFEAIEG